MLNVLIFRQRRNRRWGSVFVDWGRFWLLQGRRGFLFGDRRLLHDFSILGSVQDLLGAELEDCISQLHCPLV
jgi:hypothetical protein